MERRSRLATEGKAHPDAAGPATRGRGCPAVLSRHLPPPGGSGTQRATLANFSPQFPPPPRLGHGLGVEVRLGSEASGDGGWCSAEPDFASGRSMK